MSRNFDLQERGGGVAFPPPQPLFLLQGASLPITAVVSIPRHTLPLRLYPGVSQAILISLATNIPKERNVVSKREGKSKWKKTNSNRSLLPAKGWHFIDKCQKSCFSALLQLDIKFCSLALCLYSWEMWHLCPLFFNIEFLIPWPQIFSQNSNIYSFIYKFIYPSIHKRFSNYCAFP